MAAAVRQPAARQPLLNLVREPSYSPARPGRRIEKRADHSADEVEWLIFNLIFDANPGNPTHKNQASFDGAIISTVHFLDVPERSIRE